LHTPASEHGVDNLMMNITCLDIYCSSDHTGTASYFAFKYRGKQGQKALYFDNNKLEAIWSLILRCFAG
jgi:cytochrome c oxidase subunit 2